MIRFSNGKETSVFAASGALGLDGRGWWWERWIPRRWFDPACFWPVIKTIVWSPRKGNGWFKLAPIFDGGYCGWIHWLNPRRGRLMGWVNALGLPGPGFAQWFADLAFLPLVGKNIVVSLASIEGDFTQRIAYLAVMVEKLATAFGQWLVAIELNVSCPNTENGVMPDADEIVLLCKAAKEKTRLPLIVKLSVAQDYCAIAKRLEQEGLVEAISINSVPWKIVYPDRASPLAKFGGGGVSGRAAQPWIFEMIRKLANASSLPVIGAGVWNKNDIDHMFALGAKAVHFGSVFIASPWWPTYEARKLLEADHEKRAKSMV